MTTGTTSPHWTRRGLLYWAGATFALGLAACLAWHFDWDWLARIVALPGVGIWCAYSLLEDRWTLLRRVPDWLDNPAAFCFPYYAVLLLPLSWRPFRRWWWNGLLIVGLHLLSAGLGLAAIMATFPRQD
ncbi:MAG TPA: hypothetical protein DCX07_13300 [Phycisphaerales bacterium]|nr:hypothetical protein [Phycisphaerales bacterium]